MKIKAVIFDMDGLMFDTESISYDAWMLCGQELGLAYSQEFILSLIGLNHKSMEKKFNSLYGSHWNYKDIYMIYSKHYSKLLKERGVPIKKGLLELLCFLKDNDFKMALATSTATEGARWNLKNAGVDSYFRTYVCGDMVSKGKPDPEVFLTAAKKLDENPEDCLVLEDSINGLTAALSGGFHAVMVPDLLQPSKELEDKLAAKCDSLLDVISLLKSL